MRRARISDIVTIAARLTGVPAAEIVSPSRELHLCAIRFAVFRSARAYGYSFPEIGRAVGRRHHTSVINSLGNRQRIADYLPEVDQFCAEVAHFADELPPFVNESDWRPEPRFFVSRIERMRREKYNASQRMERALARRRTASLSNRSAGPSSPAPRLQSA